MSFFDESQLRELRKQVVGIDTEVPLLNGAYKKYVNMDNAATTPAAKPVLDAVNKFLNWYSSVHRGTGFKSILSTETYERCRKTVADFVGADANRDVVIFCKHATEALNKISYRFPFPDNSVILTSMMEHHANDLPWRRLKEIGKSVTVDHVAVTEWGEYDLEDLQAKLQRYGSRVALVAVSGASNVTGYVNPVHTVARMAHEAGAKIVVDGAQLVPHCKVEMKPHDSPEHIDFLAFSSHKMYAPFGSGALIGPREVFEKGIPEIVGGGCVKMVSTDQVAWEDPPERDEAGTPNVVGALALAHAITFLQDIGTDRIYAHEEALLRYAWDRFEKIPNMIFYSRSPESIPGRIGVIPFNLEGIKDFLVASVLGYEGAIGVRAGCFCAHPYLKHLLKVPPEEFRRLEEEAIAGNKINLPGAIRISFGFYNTKEEVDHLVEMLHIIVEGKYQGRYVPDAASGMYLPENHQLDLDSYLSLQQW